MKTLSIRVTGTSPLIMQSDTLADPLSAEAKEMRLYSKKKTKTEADFEMMGKIEMRASLYYDKEVGPFMPGANFYKSIVEGARISKKGRHIERGVQILSDVMQLEYKGPRKIDELVADPRFMYRKTVVVSRARTVRCRPIFHEWGFDAQLAFEEEIVDQRDLEEVVRTAGAQIGLGNRRPMFGTYEVKRARAGSELLVAKRKSVLASTLEDL